MIRSVAEYCAVVFHSSLTKKQNQKIEMIQKTCLKIILEEMYIGYEAVLEMTELQTLLLEESKDVLTLLLPY